jgi:hypothetical protein
VLSQRAVLSQRQENYREMLSVGRGEGHDRMQGKCLLPQFQSQSCWVFFALHDLDAALARQLESAGLDAFTICAAKFRRPGMSSDHKETLKGDAKERTATHARFAI